jgi:hypothetical protein
LLFTIENLVYKDAQIELDGYRFKNCAFVNCVLHTASGNFKLEECFVQGNWWAKVDGNALNVMKLASALDWSTVSPEFRAVWHPNGGLSIT